MLININIPVNTGAIRGTRVTSLGSRRYRNTFEKRVDPRGMHYYWMAGEVIDDDPEETDSDTRAIREDYISVTPIRFKLTDREAMPNLENIVKQVG
jgi:5'-nucleotidase